MVSDNIEPMMKAPSADENPTELAMIAIPKHSPIDNTVSISSLKNFRPHLSNDGMTNIPTKNHSTMKNNSFSNAHSISPPANF